MNLVKEDRKKIDVIIPVFNGGNFIIQAIKSADNQTYKPNSIIIINDGSSDNTEQLVLEYKKNSNNKIIYIKKENGGLSSARNAGIMNSTSLYIAFLDADDEWLKNKLEEQVKIFEKSNFPNLGVVYCGCILIDSNGYKVGKTKPILVNKEIRGKVFSKILSNNKITSSGSGVLIKSECFKKVGLFDESLKAAEDLDMWLRISQEYEFDYSEDILVKIRNHTNNMQKNSLHMFVNKVTFYNKWANTIKQNEIPDYWMNTIMGMIIRRLPRLDFLILFYKNTTKNGRKKIFFKTNGSFMYFIPIFIIMKMKNYFKTK